MDQQLTLALHMPVRNPEELASLIRRQSDPSSVDYRHWMTVREFTEKFGRTQDEYERVIRFARSSGLNVVSQSPNRLILAVQGSVDSIQKAFHVNLKSFRHPTEPRTFFAPDGEPSLHLDVPISHVSGLNNYRLPKPLRKHAAGAALDASGLPTGTGSGPNQSFLGTDIRTAYDMGPNVGTGQSVALLEFSGYAASDIAMFLTNTQQPATVPIVNISVGGGTPNQWQYDDDESECAMDIEWVLALAPGLESLRVYVAAEDFTSSGNSHDGLILSQIATDNVAKVVSSSWVWSPDDPAVDEPYFQEMAAQGQTFLQGSGDYGAYRGSDEDDQSYPGEDPYVTTVGGTTLTTAGAGGPWQTEVVWNDGVGGAQVPSFPYGGGGGIANDGLSFPIPSWQLPVITTSNGGSTTVRNVPDIAMEADLDSYECTVGVCNGFGNGTSIATPRWAAFIALVNQQLVANGQPAGLGLLAPQLYAVGQSSAYAASFHDIVQGNNSVYAGHPYFLALPGYDLTTGWGSMKGQELMSQLAGSPTQAFVPDVVGLIQADATAAITSDRLAVGTVTTVNSSTIPSGDVISQSPMAGTSVALNAVVNLVISSNSVEAAVPNVVGDTQAGAATALGAVGLSVGNVSTQLSLTVAAGLVISQNPSENTAASVGSNVDLVLSAGIPVQVPYVVGLTQDAALAAITGAGLVVGTVTTQFDSTVPQGLVISESPAAGTTVKVGSGVNLVVSTGGLVSVPNVVGLTQDAALTAITGAGLVVGTVTNQFNSTVPQGLVISESPAAGTDVRAGSGVKLVVSTGPVVPNVVGETQVAATAALVAAGFTVGNVTFQPSTTIRSGEVSGESPAANSIVNLGSAVNLVISTGPAGPSSGIILTVAGDGNYSSAGAGDGGPATAAEFLGADSVAVDSGGNLYIGDEDRVRQVGASTGIISTVAGNGTIGFSGDGGPATSAELYQPTGLAADSAGNLYIADSDNNAIRKISATTGIITTVAGSVEVNGGYSGDGGPATSAELYSPSDVAIDSGGNLYIADSYNNVIRKINATTGIISTVAGNGTGAGTGNGGYSGDGGPATSAELNYPYGVAVDPAGNLYIADSYNNVIREVTAATGIISTVAGNGTGAGTGNGGYSGDGGPATNAEFNFPSGIAVDPAGNLYIADYSNNVVRLVSVATGIITTVAGKGTGAGTGNGGYSGDGGPATSAQLYGPSSVYLDSAGNLYIADSNNNVVREVLGVVIPTTPPTVTATITGTLGNNGWYTSNVQVSWAVSGGAAPITAQTGCGTVTISADTTGQNLTCSATSAGGTTAQSVTIKRDATPPQAAAIPSPVPNGNGWNDTSVTVTFTGTDATSGIASCSVPVTITTQGANQTSPSGTCTDNAGNVSAPVTVTGINIDETIPNISDVIFDSVPESPSGWYTAPVTVSFSGTDALSGVAPNGCTSPVTLSTNGPNQSVTGTCTNRAGEVAKLTVSGIKIDTIPPVATAAATPPPNANGWNKTPVTVSFSGTDNLNGSGVASCSPGVTLSTNGAGQKASGNCTDVAGNVSAPATATASIDQIPPTINVTAPANGATYTIGSTVAASFNCADSLSGLASCVGTVSNGAPISTAATGSHAFAVTATDVAGNVIQSNIGFSVALASQTITFGAIASQMSGTTFKLQAIASSGLPVTFTSSPSSVCTVSASTASLLTTGTCTITASQSGNTSYSAAKPISQSFAVTPKLRSDTVTLGISSGSEAYGVRNTFATGPSYTGSPVPTGTVTLYDNSTALVTLTLGFKGVAYYTANPLNAGVNVLTGSYSGDSHYSAAISAPVTLYVTPAPVKLTGSCWGGTPYKVAYQCVVTASAATATPPTGSITYSLDGASATPVALSNGSASFTVATLPASGAHKLTIAYPGQGNYAAGTTLTESFTTVPGQTQLVISASSYYLAAGSPVTLTVKGSSPQSGTPTGSVTFYDNGATVGSAMIGTNGVATYTVASIPKGTNSYTAKYAATANYAAATSGGASVTAH